MTFTPTETANLPIILQECQAQGLTLPKFKEDIAYILATARHETANWRFLEEIDGRNQAIKLGYDGGENYYGRGYVQLTHKYNYQKFSTIMSQDLVNNPNLVLDPKDAAFILVYGMRNGSFTGKKLDDFAYNYSCGEPEVIDGIANAGDRAINFIPARGIVNGNDQAMLINNYAREYVIRINKGEFDQFFFPKTPTPPTQIPTNPINLDKVDLVIVPQNVNNEKTPTPETWAKLEKETDDDHFKLVKDAVQNLDWDWLISSYADRVKERKDFEKDADDLNNHYSDLATNFQEAHDKNYIFSKDLAEKDLEIGNLKTQIEKLVIPKKENFDFQNAVKNPSQNLENLNSKEIFKDEKNYSEIENVQANNPTTQEKWSWDKFWVGLSRNATISSIIGIMITGLVGYVCSLVPQLTPYQNQMVGGLLLLTGISTVGQNANNLLKK